MMLTKEQLRIPVRGTNRKYYLVPPAPKKNRPDFYVRFQVPADLRRRNPELPLVVYQSTGTDLIAAARLRGRDKIEAVLEGRWKDAEKSKLARPRTCTVGQILAAYKPLPRTVKPGIAHRNKKALELVLREVTGRSNAETLLAEDVLTAKTLRKFIAGRLEAVRDKDLIVQERTAITINSTLAQAMSVLSPRVTELYAELKLPDLKEFRAVRKLSVDADVSYDPLPNECLTKMEAAAAELKAGRAKVEVGDGGTKRFLTPAEQQAVYLVYLLMSRLGLRNNEAYAARWGWIERRGNEAEMVLKRRADHVIKNKRGRNLDMDPELLAELDTHRGLPDAWIVPGATPTNRVHACYRWINSWLRGFIPPGREKGAYELRKHAISVIVSRPESEGGGIVAAAAFAGDTIATTEKHYASYLRKVRGIRSSEISLRVLDKAEVVGVGSGA